MKIIGSIKCNTKDSGDLIFTGADIDCEDGTSISISTNFLESCKYNGDGIYSLDVKVDSLLVDGEECEVYDISEMFDYLNNASLFEVQMICDDSDSVNVRSFVIELDDGTICNLSVGDVTVVTAE